MPIEAADAEGELPPPGSRSGRGAQSVLPYLTRTLQAKPFAAVSDTRELSGPPRSPSSGERSSLSN
jgi:hypothetical protein